MTASEHAVYTFGHAAHGPEAFFALLRAVGAAVLADVRSVPYSKPCPHFRKAELERLAPEWGLRYAFLGEALGGRPRDPALLDALGRPDYGRIRRSPTFMAGIEDLLGLVREASPVVLLCGEEDPGRCHRRLLIGRELLRRGLTVRHLRADGAVQAEADLPAPENQPSLLDFA